VTANEHLQLAEVELVDGDDVHLVRYGTAGLRVGALSGVSDDHTAVTVDGQTQRGGGA
jgi:hypothetical protein